MSRAFLIVMDSVGCGGAPDAADFGDFGGPEYGYGYGGGAPLYGTYGKRINPQGSSNLL